MRSEYNNNLMAEATGWRFCCSARALQTLRSALAQLIRIVDDRRRRGDAVSVSLAPIAARRVARDAKARRKCEKQEKFNANMNNNE